MRRLHWQSAIAESFSLNQGLTSTQSAICDLIWQQQVNFTFLYAVFMYEPLIGAVLSQQLGGKPSLQYFMGDQEGRSLPNFREKGVP